MGYEQIEEIISDIDEYYTETDLREDLQQIYFICIGNTEGKHMSENNKNSISKTIIEQAEVITNLSNKLKETQEKLAEKDEEVKEIKYIRRNTEAKNCILMNALKKIEDSFKTCDGLTFFDYLSKIKSILDEATKQL